MLAFLVPLTILAPSSWAGLWTEAGRGSPASITVSLFPDGTFDLTQQPAAQSKPTPTAYLRGRWSAKTASLELDTTEHASVMGPIPKFWFGDVAPSKDRFELRIVNKGKDLACPYPITRPTMGSLRLDLLQKSSEKPKRIDWPAMERRAAELKSVKPKVVKRVLPPGTSRFGKK